MAGLIPQQFIDDVLDRVDIVEVIDRRVSLKKKWPQLHGLLSVPRRKKSII